MPTTIAHRSISTVLVLLFATAAMAEAQPGQLKSRNLSPRFKVIATDSLPPNVGDAIVVREPGHQDELFVRTSKITPNSILRAMRQLELLRIVQGDTASEAGTFLISLDNQPKREGGRDAQLEKTELGRQKLKDERLLAQQIAFGLTANNPGGQRYSRKGVGEGRFITASITRPAKRTVQKRPNKP